MSRPPSPTPGIISRRQFLERSASAPAVPLAAAALAGAATALTALAAAEPLPAAVIGHTGRGDYGHGMDVIFDGVPGVRVVAVADPDEGGRAQAAQRCKAERQYADWREMLQKEKPRLVSLAPRWSEGRREVALAAIEAGAHLFSEKPFTPTPAEGDEILAAADRAGAKVVVGHQMRMNPSVRHLKRAIDAGLIGDVLHLHAWGKQDGRAGGEDMLVLGTHVFDLIRLFAGDPLWCTARVLQGGRDITRADARAVGERIGPVAGDEIYAQFAFDKGVNASFNSRGRMREITGVWGIEFVGSNTRARIVNSSVDPDVYVLTPGKWDPSGGRTDAWSRLPDDPAINAPSDQRGFAAANRRLVDDWLDAIRTDREPECSGRNANKALEMVMAVYHAALSGARVPMPLKDRGHPLG